MPIPLQGDVLDAEAFLVEVLAKAQAARGQGAQFPAKLVRRILYHAFA